MAKPDFRKIPAWAYLLVAFAITVNVFYIIARFQIPIDGAGSRGISGQCTITSIRPGSPAEIGGLLIGDIIQQIGTRNVPGGNHFWILEDYHAGDQLDYHITRDGEQLIISVSLGSFWSQHPWFYFVLYLVILTVCITSLFIIYKKPFDGSVRLFFIYLQLFAIVQNSRFLFFDETYATIANTAFILSFNLFGIVLFHFHLIFPKPAKLFQMAKPVLVVLYITGLIIGIVIMVLLIRRNLLEPGENSEVFFQFSRWSIAWMGFTLSLALAMAIYQFSTIKDAMARKQLRLVIIGSVFGLITPIAFSIDPGFIWRIETEKHLLTLLEFTNAAGSYIMTSFLVIAIFRYRMWDIETFIRKAILYTIATTIILITYLLVVFVVDILAIRQTTFVHFIILAISTVTFLLLRDIIQRLIDRIFQRESYDSATVVALFEEKLAGIYNYNELNEKICQGINDIFHTEFIALVKKKTDLLYEIEFHEGNAGIQPVKIIRLTENFEFQLNRSMIFSSEEIQHKPDELNYLKSEFFIPLIDQGKAIGFIILGNKLSEQSYTLQDIRVLNLLSRRIVALYHTAALFLKDLERKLMLERERTRIAEDMHDDVGASLSRIAMLSEISRNSIEEHHKLKHWLGQISETSREVIDEMNQIIWALNPKNDTLDGLVAFIRRFAMEFFETSSARCTIELPENMQESVISVEVRRNIYLVVREALHNAMKHSGAKEVRIKLDKTKKGFNIVILDDGKGFDLQNLKYQGNGLKNMKKRMDDIGGEILITSQPGEGTKIKLSVNER